jgi:hypothetical protein
MYKRIPDRDKLQARAAILAAEGELSDNGIARLCGITRRTLMRWKKLPAVQQKMVEHLTLSKLHSEVQMISERHERIADMDARSQNLQDIIRARANSPEMGSIPGGRTGLMVRGKVVRSRWHGGLIANYGLDIGLLQELSRLEVAAAKALGQWQRPKYQPIVSSMSTGLASGKQYRAALLIADSTKSDLDIAAACGINRRTLARWKEQPSFGARVAEIRTAIFGDVILVTLERSTLVREEKTAGTQFAVDTGRVQMVDRLNAGRKRVAEEKARRDANTGT